MSEQNEKKKINISSNKENPNDNPLEKGRTIYMTTDDDPNDQDEGGHTFGDIWHMMIKHWKAWAIFTVAAVAIGATYGLGFQKPKWQSTGSVILIASNDSSTTTSSDATITSTNLSLSLALLPSLVDFMNDETVMNKVMTDTNTKFSENYKLKDIKELVSSSARTYSSLEKSLYVDVTATSSDKELSKYLVTAVINNAYTIAQSDDSVYSKIFKDAIVPSSSASDPIDAATSTAKICLISGLVGLVVGALYGIIFELANTRVVSPKDLELLTDTKVIATIPLIDSDGEKKEGNN